MDKRATVIGLFTSGVAVVMATVFPEIGLVAALAAAPAYLAGYAVAKRASDVKAAADHGVTLEVLHEVRRTYGSVQMRQDIRTLRLADGFKSDVERLAPVVQERLRTPR